MQSPPKILDQSSSIISHRARIDSRLTDHQSRNLLHFKDQIESNYRRSVANHIYSFPLQLEYCASLVSSDQSSLQRAQEYDLHYQNKKYDDLQRQLHSKRLETEKNKIQIQQKKQRKKLHIRNQSALAKKKYRDLIKLLDRSISPKKGKNTKKGKDKQHLPTFIQEKQKDLHQYKQEKTRAKSNRLKTELDESFKSTFRKPITKFKFRNINYKDQ